MITVYVNYVTYDDQNAPHYRMFQLEFESDEQLQQAHAEIAHARERYTDYAYFRTAHGLQGMTLVDLWHISPYVENAKSAAADLKEIYDNARKYRAELKAQEADKEITPEHLSDPDWLAEHELDVINAFAPPREKDEQEEQST